MELYIGTSGYSYDEWKGKFYPKELPAKERLAYYAKQFRAVEINNTFYRMPTPAMLAAWTAQVPANFCFAFKAPGRITHQQRLSRAEDATRHFIEVTRGLKTRAGPLLFQLPPSFHRDDARLEAFVRLLPRDVRCAFEFRHASWCDPAVYEMLHSHGIALCVSDMEESVAERIDATTDWGYLRLRRTFYDDDALKEWLRRIRAQTWRCAYVFFKHEDEARGPDYAQRLIALAGN